MACASVVLSTVTEMLSWWLYVESNASALSVLLFPNTCGF